MLASLIRQFLRGLARLPFAWVQRAGALLGWVGWLVPNDQRRVTERNLELCFPELSAAERRSLARRTLIELGRTVGETIAIWLGPQTRLGGLICEVRGEEALRAAAAEGRGVILCAPHLGSWEMAGLWLGAHYAITSMYQPPRLQVLEAEVREARERTGARLVPTDAGGIRALYQTLREGKIIGILPDQNPRDRESPFAPFFGIQTRTPTLVSRFAARTGARVFFTFAERLPRGRGFRLHLLEGPSGIDDPDPVRAATALNAGVEQCVRMAPAQYQWSYKRFRSRPRGEAALY
jgi:KDO2-lipid IV(A) lauroyltransferase